MSDRPRVIVALTDNLECAAVADWLVAGGFDPVRRSSAGAAAQEMQVRAFDLLVADAAAAFREGLLTLARRRNPLMPSVVIGDAATTPPPEAIAGQVMYLTRPLDRAILVCTVSMAIADGRPVRRSARKLVNRFDAIVNGIPSHIIDVSKEGVRLEMPRERRSVPPPYFNVRVPLIGVAVTVQRMWARASPGIRQNEVTLCGGALAENRPAAEQAWRVFVETVPVHGQLSSGSLQIQ
jgi:hypothetical protein